MLKKKLLKIDIPVKLMYSITYQCLKYQSIRQQCNLIFLIFVSLRYGLVFLFLNTLTLTF